MSNRREVPHWHCNKRWTDVSKTREALQILESDFSDKTWNEGKQSYYAILLNKKRLSDSTNPRSTRAILGTFKFFGFAYTRGGKLLVTTAGREFVHGSIRETLKSQLLKWQYPNPFEAKGGVAPYTSGLTLFPFRVLLRLVKEMGPIHENELALFVWKTRSEEESEIKKTKEEILNFRKLDANEKKKMLQKYFLFVTNHEYEAHLRPYILATGLCSFDVKGRFLSISEQADDEVNSIVGESVEVKTDWKDEDEWFDYFGDLRHRRPPMLVHFQIGSKKGPASNVYVKVSQNGTETHGITDNTGLAAFSLYDGRKFTMEIALPKTGNVLLKDSFVIGPETKSLKIEIAKASVHRKETVDEIVEKTRQLLKKGLDEEIEDRLEMKSRVEKKKIEKSQMRHLRGGRFEQLVFGLFDSFRGKVFSDVIWNGKVGEWGLPIPAQKVSEHTGKKLPDILVFQNHDLYAVETTLLKGRAQWEKPEAVSVPEHVEDMIEENKSKNVSGLFIAGVLESSVQINLVTRAINKGYKIVPIEAEEFLKIIKLLEISGKDFWKGNFDQLWNIQKRSVAQHKDTHVP